MNSSAIMWAVPFYLFMIALELFVSWIKNRKLYSLSETVSNISCGVVQQVGDAVLNLVAIPIYIYVNKELSLIQFSSNLFTFVLLFVYKDFVYYWTHRLVHSSKLWAIHLVHHQPKTFNFSVGLRMPLFHYVIDFIPMMLAAILGFSVQEYIFVSVIFASVQLFNHTTLFKKEIPIVSKLFVTPSFHRVHHAKNDPYVNKNFSAVICLWDKIFNTYQKELECTPVEFGVKKESEYGLNPVMANFVYWGKGLEETNRRLFLIKSLMLLIPALVFIATAKFMPIYLSSFLALVILFLYSITQVLWERFQGNF